MDEINLENLNVLVEKAVELKQVLSESPEILQYLRLIKEIGAEKVEVPRVDDVLLRAGDAAKILGVGLHKCGVQRLMKMNLYVWRATSKRKCMKSSLKKLMKKN